VGYSLGNGAETIRDASTASQAFKSALEVVGGVAPEVTAAIRSELEDSGTR
jgi:uncharacterized protein with GYD domain